MARNLQAVDPHPHFHTVPERDPHIVVLHTQGPHAGLFEIAGRVSQLGEHELPEVIETPMLAPRQTRGTAAIGLVQARPRFVLYKEWNGPQKMKRFDGRQA